MYLRVYMWNFLIWSDRPILCLESVVASRSVLVPFRRFQHRRNTKEHYFVYLWRLLLYHLVSTAFEFPLSILRKAYTSKLWKARGMLKWNKSCIFLSNYCIIKFCHVHHVQTECQLHTIRMLHIFLIYLSLSHHLLAYDTHPYSNKYFVSYFIAL